ncbi:MAG TPA: TfoX/Sxy family protein [Vicinamibacterales bacterium]|nr:TfoX/Sxy family protein [Vicinamibacterales bacterium]
MLARKKGSGTGSGTRGRRTVRATRSLAGTHGFRDFVLDQLSSLGEVVARSMFGGVGLYCDGLFFGIIARDVLYLKVDASNRPDYERAGRKPFRPYPDRPGTMQYYETPVGVLENAPELVRWARTSVAAAARAAR